MANHTVYPYGTNGELPSSIGLVNDLATGGVDMALTAEQGKIIGEKLGGIERAFTVPLTTGGIIAATCIDGFGEKNSSAALSCSDYIDCSGYSSLKYRLLKFTSSSSNLKYGLVFYDEENVAITGYPSQIASSAAETQTEVEIPANAKYFRLTYWNNSTSVGVSLTTPDKLHPKTLVNVLNAKFYTYFSSATSVNFSLAQLNSGGYYAVTNENNQSKIVMDLRGRDYSKQYRLSLKYKNVGTSPSNFWCVYVSSIGQSGNEGSVFSGYANLPVGEGELTTIIPRNSTSRNFIQISSASSYGMPKGAVSTLYDLQIEEVEDGGGIPSGTPYEGPLVKVEPQHYVTANKAAKIASVACQGGACYGNYLFLFSANNTTCWINDLESGTLIQTITIPEVERGFVSNCHCNTVNFGHEKYDSNDPFPLIYVSTGYDSEGYTGALVYRVIATTENNVTSYSLSLVQTLKMPTTPSSWTEFVIGADGDCYICYTSIKKIYRMILPSVTSGDKIFDLSEALSEYQFPPQPSSWLQSRGQNRMYNNGKIIYVSGVPSSGEKSLFVVLDLASMTREVVIDLAQLGLTKEPETCFIWNGQFCIAFNSGDDVYSLDFV